MSMWDLSGDEGQIEDVEADFRIIWCLVSLEAILRLLEPTNRIPATLQEKKKSMDPTLSEGTPSLDENWNGHETLNLNQAVVQPKLTEKGKAYRLFERSKD